MIFDSVGFGEWGIILILGVLLMDPKKLGKAVRGWKQFKRKAMQIQGEVKTQLDALVAEDENAEAQKSLGASKSEMRRWGREQAQALSAAARNEAAQAILSTLSEWPGYKNAKTISCFVGALDEPDTEPLLRKILADGKTLLVPYIDNQGGAKTMGMAAIADFDRDLREGEFRLLEPLPELRRVGDGDATAAHLPPPEPELVFVPGSCFDMRGGRLGKGLGFYDKYLATRSGMKIGLCFDAQIARKNLALEAHDQLMDALASEKRFLIFSGAQGAQEDGTTL